MQAIGIPLRRSARFQQHASVSTNPNAATLIPPFPLPPLLPTLRNLLDLRLGGVEVLAMDKMLEANSSFHDLQKQERAGMYI